VSRILFLTERFPPDIGGVARSANRLSQNLCQLGVEVDILTWSRFLQPGEVLEPEQPELNLNIYRVGLYRHWDMTMIHTLNILDWLHQLRNYDAVWGHYLFPAGFLAVWFARLNGLVSLVSARGNDVEREVFPPGDFARLQWTLEGATAIAAVSEDLARKIKLIVKREDVFILENAVDTNIFSPFISPAEKLTLRHQLGIADDEVVLVFSGELREKKGQNFLLQCLTKVREFRPACLLIIGEVRNSQDPMLQVYATQRSQDWQRIIMTGHLSEQKQIARYLQIGDIFLQPSLWEGLPNALLEAMACGCTCIASDAGGIPEIITHQVDGFLLPRQQLNYLGEAVLEYLKLDLSTQNRIQKSARDRIVSEFSLKSEKVRLQALLEEVLNSL
jgi:L-malate glycosyltransferase